MCLEPEAQKQPSDIFQMRVCHTQSLLLSKEFEEESFDGVDINSVEYEGTSRLSQGEGAFRVVNGD